ncbi:AMP-binding domain-containing protein/DUF4009 domain-containing protein, partial [Cephalotus follicularis]
MSLGAIITTTNPLNTPREIAKQIADSNPKFVFTTFQLISKLASSNLPIILLDDNNNNPANTKVVTTLIEMMKKEPSESRVRDRVKQDDTATLLYSSGTTGASKGVILSHRNLIALIEAKAESPRFKEEHHTVIGTIPMFHVYGLTSFVMSFMALGSTVVVLSKFQMQDMLLAIEKYRATCLPLVPPILVAMVNNAGQIKGRYDLSSLKMVMSGGATLSKQVIVRFIESYPEVRILQGYAMTESVLGATTDSMEESMRYGTVGLLAASYEAKIVDPYSSESLSVNRTGELWLRGPGVMKGYFNNPETTSVAIDSEGWLKTGDLCYIDDDGFLFVVDRLKELIKYKGHQVPPAELESLLLTHPEISDAAVIPFPDEEDGQHPMAYVVRKPKSDISENTVMDFVAKQVAPYKKIRKVAFVTSIPKNPSGKILRKDLIKLATSKL